MDHDGSGATDVGVDHRLLDYLVGAGEERGWDRNVQRLSGLEKLWNGGEGVASSLPTKLMEMPPTR
jgi:hypothetical protein